MSDTGLGVCYGRCLAPLRDDARVTESVEDTLSGCEPGKRRMYRVYVPGVEGVWAPAVHSSCLHNEYAALALRTLGDTPDDPPYAVPLVDEQFRVLRNLVRRLNVVSWSRAAVAASYKGALGRRYAKALVDLENDGLSDVDARLSGFLKGEKFNPMAKVSKPRLINPRSPVFNLELATYLKPLEHALWRKWKVGVGCRRTRVSGKGLNGLQRAALIREKMDSVGDCVVFEVDGKAFESHVTDKQLAREHGVYKAAYPGDEVLVWMLEKQLKLSGRTQGGIKYTRPGGRASGDYNTGLGNTLLMGVFVICALQSLAPAGPWTVLADGDNCLIFLHSSLRHCVGRFGDAMSAVCAHEMTVEKPVTVLEEVCFGQSKPCFTERGLIMVRDPFKALSGAFCGYRHFHDPHFAPRLVRGIAMAELSLARGVPVLGAYFAEAEYLTRKYKSLKNVEFFLEGHLLGLPPDPGIVKVSLDARVSFERAWGISPEEQLSLERLLVEGLRRDFVRVLDSGVWLSRVTPVTHGPGPPDASNAAEHLFLER